MFKKVKYTFLMLLLALPSASLAYSDYIIASGENVGIRLNSDGILVIGTYEIETNDPASEAGLEIGDIIVSVNDTEVSNIEDMTNIISNDSDTIKIGYIRDDIKSYTNLKLYNGKTGLYVKDSVSGIGTLTYIDPNTKLFGALGHEIIESISGNILNISDGVVFESSIVGIEPSRNGTPGEKRATLSIDNVYGKIFENTNKGVFGNYSGQMDQESLYKVAQVEDIKLGEAEILTVIEDNTVKSYSINILKVSVNNAKTKNIIFEITDKYLLEKTGGIIQGMSGSPIVQGEYIIGAVTHVVVDDPSKGYGILITNMLEEAEN